MSPRKPRLSPDRSIGRRSREASRLASRGPVGNPTESELGPFRVECDQAVATLRRSLVALTAAAGCDPLRPQEVSRKLGLNKNLTWKIARILIAPDSFEAVSMMPGGEGLDIYLRAFTKAGAPAELVDAVRTATVALGEVVVRHFGDRAQLELVLDGLRADGNLENSRRLAFRGMSGVFGVQAHGRLTTQILSPSAGREHQADLSIVAGLVGLQRLRPLGSMPIFRSKPIVDADPSASGPLFPGEREGEYLIREFSHFPNARVHSSSEAGRHIVELADAPIGRVGASDLYFGSFARGAMNTRRKPDDLDCELVTSISIPAENFASDIFVHDSFGGLETLDTSLHSTLSHPFAAAPSIRAASRLPVDVSPQIVDDLTHGFGLRFAPRYEEIVARMFARLGQDPRDYRLIRVAMEFPPAPAAVLVRWELPA